MNLILETTTGRPTPAGTVPQLPRASTDATLQLVTNGVAALLPEGQPVALKIYTPDDLVTPVATFSVWARNATYQLYTATLAPLTTGLAWLREKTLRARVSYGTPNVDSELFHLMLGGSGGAAPDLPQIVITQPAGPVKQTVSLGAKTGNLKLEAYGNHVVQADAKVNGMQLYANTAPVGADVLVELRKGGVGTGAVATLSAGSKAERTPFDPVVNVEAGDVLDFEVIQIGSTKPGGYLSTEMELELV
ncbi:hypothetical protein [Actomonas aquatica]|uniref:Uncharacterized protein n=1 Tax=Actomonas aquatica TaxID=2866162 RepID=A0ABZ1CCN4_9BACT|nr:hypothetical protein [Opitutus sp. WL0086]WRQ89410.1 hypothetical protein K1X11_008310 [Opitutus sp. WL0086]